MVNVIGLGYIGLPTALMMATHGVEVVGTDYNEELVATLNAGHTTFKEEGLDELFVDALKSGIKFTTEYQVCDTYIVSVPTPYDKLDKKIDPCYVIAACKTVLEVAPKGAVLVIESTISPNTVDRFVRPLLIEAEREDVKLVHAPERIIPGNMVYELLHNNRTIGADDPEVGEEVAKIYATFCQGEISVTDIRTNAGMPEYVLHRAHEVMAERGIKDASKVGIYGLTYKEDVDDVRESPTLQMLDSMEEHLCGGAVKVYDPWVERDEVPGQVHSMEEFLDGLEMVIVMVGHSQIKGKPEVFGDRILIDPRNVCGDGENVYKL